MEAAPHPWPALGVLLLRDGFVTTEDLEEILAEQRDSRKQRLTGWRLGEILVERGVVSQDQVARLVAEQYELPFVELDEDAVDTRIASRLPEDLVERFSALPIEIQPDGTLLLAVADPAVVLFSDELRRAAGMPLRFAVAAPAALRAAIVSVRARTTETAASFDSPSFALVRASAESYVSTPSLDRAGAGSSAEVASWPPLGTLLMRDGLVSEEELETALAQQRLSSTKRLGEILVERGSVTRNDVARVIAEQYELAYIDLVPEELDPRLGALLPEDVARRYSAVPVRFEPDGSLLVAVADPTKVLDPEEILEVLGARFTFAVADPDAIESALLRRRLAPVVDPPRLAEDTPAAADDDLVVSDDAVDADATAGADTLAERDEHSSDEPADEAVHGDDREESFLAALSPQGAPDDQPTEASQQREELETAAIVETDPDAGSGADLVLAPPAEGDQGDLDPQETDTGDADALPEPAPVTLPHGALEDTDVRERDSEHAPDDLVLDAGDVEPVGDAPDPVEEAEPLVAAEDDPDTAAVVDEAPAAETFSEHSPAPGSALDVVVRLSAPGAPSVAPMPDEPPSETTEPKTHGTVLELIERARTLGAASVHFSPQEERLVVRVRVDGTMRDVASLDDAARTTAEDDLRALARDHDEDVQVAVLPTRHGDSVVVQLPENRDWTPTLADLSLPEDDEALLREALAHTSGLVLVVGPPESGRTTTLYAAFCELEPRERALVTVESPVHRTLPEVDQVAVDEHFDGDVVRAFSSALAVDPDVVLVDEIEDSELAGLAVHAAPGRLVLTTLDAPSAGGAVRRLHDLGVDVDASMRALTAVVTQRIVRRLCTSCRESYFATAEELRELGRPEDEAGVRLLARGKGCRSCVGTGFRGRVGIVSVLAPPPELAALASRGEPADEIVHTLEALSAERLRASAVRLALDGVTTPAEALTATSRPDES